MDEKNQKNLFGIGVIVGVTLMVAVGGVLFVNLASDWYATLQKPSFQPPAMWFGVAWSILYLLIAASAILVFLSHGPRFQRALILFGINAILNLLWTFLFFALQNSALAFIDLILLWVMTVLLIREVFPTHKTAAGLLIPYILWLTFALALNYSIYMMN